MIAKHVDINKATEFGKFIKEKTSYEFVYKSLAGIFNGVDPWIGSFDFSYVLENIIINCNSKAPLKSIL